MREIILEQAEEQHNSGKRPKIKGDKERFEFEPSLEDANIDVVDAVYTRVLGNEDEYAWLALHEAIEKLFRNMITRPK